MTGRGANRPSSAGEFRRARERASQETVDLRRRAACTVVANAHDQNDLAHLLAMLDLPAT
jgi:hypothetical protein